MSDIMIQGFFIGMALGYVIGSIIWITFWSVTHKKLVDELKKVSE